MSLAGKNLHLAALRVVTATAELRNREPDAQVFGDVSLEYLSLSMAMKDLKRELVRWADSKQIMDYCMQTAEDEP